MTTRIYVFALVCSLHVSAQSPDSLAWAFSDSGMVWCQSTGWGNITETYGYTDRQIFTDGTYTMRNGYRYTNLFVSGETWNSTSELPPTSFFYNLAGSFRNDTINKSVEIILSGDSLLYDFNLNIGDTIFSFPLHNTVIVDSISIMQIGGLQRRVYYYSCKRQPCLGFLIEGVGPFTGLGEGPINRDVDFGANLQCFTTANLSYSVGSNSLTYNPAGCSWCRGKTLDVADPQPHVALKVSPNPAADQVKLHLPARHGGAMLSVQNIFGQTVYIEQLSGDATEKMLNVSDFTSGTYFAVIKTTSDTAFTKFVIVR